MDLQDLLSDSGKKFLGEAKQITATGRRVGPMGTSVCDVSQDPTVAQRLSPWMPTLMKSSEIVLIRNGNKPCTHIFTPSELAFSQGWPTVKAAPKRFRDCMMFDMGGLSNNNKKIMLGNGIHLFPITAWHFYVFSHVVRKDVIAKLHMPLATCLEVIALPDSDSD